MKNHRGGVDACSAKQLEMTKTNAPIDRFVNKKEFVFVNEMVQLIIDALGSTRKFYYWQTI